MTSLIEDYFEYTKKHMNEYGEKCIVLMMVGAFYEMYGIREKGGNNIITMSEIENVCNICELAVKQKSHDHKNCDLFMAGFRDYSLDKYLAKITSEGYRCFVYDQFVEETSGIIRKLTNIYSSGTMFGVNNVNKKLSNNISCIWAKISMSPLKDKQIIWGFSTINTNTGSSNVFEFESSTEETGINEIERYLSIHNPSEIIFICDENEENDLVQYLNIIKSSTNLLNIIHTNNKPFVEIIENCGKQIYIQECFTKYFEINEYSNFIEHYSYYQIASQSFCFLLDWVFKHNVYLTTRLDEPKLEIHSKNTYLGCHTLKQLNIISERKNESVIDLLNICKTSMGKRLLREQMVQPIYDCDHLNKEYDITDNLIKNYETITTPTRCILHNFCDNQYLLRTLILRKITPKQIYNIHNNILLCNDILKLVKNNKTAETYLSEKKYNINQITDANRRVQDTMNSIFKIEKLCEIDNVSLNENIFNVAYSQELNDFEKEMSNNKDELNNIILDLNKIISVNEKKPGEYVKLYETEKALPHIICTKKRSEAITKYLSNGRNPLDISGSVLSLLSIHKNNVSSVYLTNEYIHKVTSKYMKFRDDWREKLVQTFKYSIEDMILMFDDLKKMGNIVSLVDVITSKAEISLKFNYCRPQIRGEKMGANSGEKSYVNAREMRHSLIERLDNDDTYVSNDISLGQDEQGILLYGTNAVGKTSLIKALGICIVLAQSGFFVPCSEFIYYPYTQLFTRILNNDNMFKGLSTFATEMVEMRTILNMSDNRTCVLGDELCSGTEHDSAVSIFVAGLQWLYDKQSSFIFATHLHEITKLQEINGMTELSLKHLTVKYDKGLDMLIYDRKLKDGVGDTLYGLEVCKSLHLPQQFIDNAYTIRNKYKGIKTLLDSNTSTRYNSKVIINKCSICNINDASEVHHIKEQRDANAHGFINNVHKNHKSNLLPICEKCHNHIHKNNVKLEKLKTSKGVQIIANS